MKFSQLAALTAALAVPAAMQAALPAYTATPADGSTVSEVRVIEVKFDGNVELADDCYVNTDEGVGGNSQKTPRVNWEGCTYQPVFCNEIFDVHDGNTLYLEAYMEYTQDGKCEGSDWMTVLIKGVSYTVNGEAGEDILLTYYFGEAEEVSYTVTPEPGSTVKELQVVEVKFDGLVELTDGCYFNTDEGATGDPDLNPRISWEDCTYPMIFTNERYEVRDGNTLYLESYLPWTAEDYRHGFTEWFTITIYGDSYSVNGQPGKDLVLTWNVTEEEEVPTLVVKPASETSIPELKVIEVKFNGDVEVELAEGCEVNIFEGNLGNPELCPLYEWETSEEPVAFCTEKFTVVDGNTLYLEKYAAVNALNLDGSSWVNVEIPGACYTVDGEQGEDLLFTYFFTETAVKAFFGENTALEVFDMQGRRVMSGASASDLKSLKGIYVVNGKKVIL